MRLIHTFSRFIYFFPNASYEVGIVLDVVYLCTVLNLRNNLILSPGVSNRKDACMETEV